ncbi:P-loop containing nucleoside triphosphate hydrolase protein [Auriscalpium vulgare]|uniref:P-loop containing nucleoside triphosphate hydrolase protein n=1 Tax=Auriscalpium vulgare TaxID=40419 RepID=A0ACB8RLT9_9AGAM|nr:P-loop containing nucleoside triphosphate hydrolase protein [Auriscalpium vulgare]
MQATVRLASGATTCATQLGRRRRAGRELSSAAAASPIVHIPKANIYRFGDPNGAHPVLRDVEWTVHEGQSWAVVGSGAGEKTALLETLLGNMRLLPPPAGGVFPFLAETPSTSRSQSRPLSERVSLVSFSHRPRASGGSFYDYTARYGAVREEDRVTLRESMFPEESGLIRDSLKAFFVDKKTEMDEARERKVREERAMHFQDLVKKLGLEQFLDLPLVALSNGQTRRARIVKALLDRPEVLLLDEPLTGLDVYTRPTLLDLLHSLNEAHSPRVIMGLRTQDPIPVWVSHVALVSHGRVHAGPKDDILAKVEHNPSTPPAASVTSDQSPRQESEALVEMQDVNVKYHDRHVLKDINWTLRAGDRWHLQGANGSGKTTLMSILTGDHPQSYTQRAPSSLHLFGKSRRAHATASLRTRIGVVSPELYNAWPRARPMSVWEAIATGFDGGFVPLGPDGLGVGLSGQLSPEERAWRERRVWEVLDGLGQHRWCADDLEREPPAQFASRAFAGLSAGAQSVVLLMRALVGRPSVVLLDEVWAGMDEAMIAAARTYLRGGGVGAEQAVVVISHWEEEVPWGPADGVRRYRLEAGAGREV